MHPRSYSRPIRAGLLGALLVAALPAMSVAGSKSTGYGYSTGSREGDPFAYAIVGLTETGGLTLSGSTDSDDWANLKALAKREKREVLWIKQDGRSWLCRDADAIAKTRAIMAPMNRIGQAQAALGERQAALGEKQAALGQKQAELGGQQARLGAKMARISVRMTDADDDRDESRELSRERDAVEREMEELGRRMEDLGAQQSVLGAKQSALGKEQSALGAQQAAESRKADEAMRRHAGDLRSKGLLEEMD